MSHEGMRSSAAHERCDPIVPFPLFFSYACDASLDPSPRCFFSPLETWETAVTLRCIECHVKMASIGRRVREMQTSCSFSPLGIKSPCSDGAQSAAEAGRRCDEASSTHAGRTAPRGDASQRGTPILVKKAQCPPFFVIAQPVSVFLLDSLTLAKILRFC